MAGLQCLITSCSRLDEHVRAHSGEMKSVNGVSICCPYELADARIAVAVTFVLCSILLYAA